jgi:predicted N-acetyltransferase YhbS
MSVRDATVADRAAIADLVRAAFSGDGRDGAEEVDIVTATWHSQPPAGVPGLELVAVAAGVVVGHVLSAFGDLAGSAVAAVAPLAVAPAHQGAGVGSALMTETIERAEAMGLALLVLLGEPEYYRRFGFETAADQGVIYRPAGASNPHFLLRRLGGYDPSLRGAFVYHWEATDAPKTK